MPRAQVVAAVVIGLLGCSSTKSEPPPTPCERFAELTTSCGMFAGNPKRELEVCDTLVDMKPEDLDLTNVHDRDLVHRIAKVQKGVRCATPDATCETFATCMDADDEPATAAPLASP